MKRMLFLFLLICVIVFNTSSQTWLGMLGDHLYNGSGIEEPCVQCIKRTYDDSLYIAGGFKYAGTLVVNAVAGWDGNNWYNFNNGCPYGGAYCIEKYKGKLYVGGSMWEMPNQPSDAYLAVWYNNQWNAPEGGTVYGEVWGFKIFQDKLFMCGNMQYIGSVPYDKIAAFDGINWINVGSFGMWAQNLEIFNNELYACGYWGVRKYLGGTTWVDLPIQPNDFVFDLEADTFNTFLYVGGQFTVVDGQYSSGVAMWDGFKWNPMGYYCNTVWRNSMKVYRGDLYTGSGFVYDSIADEYHFYITRWNGSQWDSIGGDFNNWSLSMEIYNDELLMGGADYNNGVPTGGIVRLYMPDTGCGYIKPRINTLVDTFYLSSGQAQVQFYNNNPYVDSWSWTFGDGGTDNIKDPLYTYTDTGTYNVQVTVTHNVCTKTAQKTVVILFTSVADECSTEEKEFDVFPNPATSELHLKFSGIMSGSFVITLYDIQGKPLRSLTTKESETVLDISQLPVGVYGVKVVGNGVYRMSKVVKL